MTLPISPARSNYFYDLDVNVQVPDDFMGMCLVRYPVAGNNPDGLVNYKTLRLCQQTEMNWGTIETSAGNYDSTALANLDSIVTFNRQRGVSLMFGLYRTPRFYADNTTPNPSVTDYNQTGPWGHLGECAHPTNLTAVSNFVTMLVNRYNKAGGAWYDTYGSTLGKGIKSWELWNEPPVTTTKTNQGTFYWGNRGQLVDLCKVQYDAIKAADSSIIVLSPGFVHFGQVIDFLNVTGSAYPSTKGADVCDAVAYHSYVAVPKHNEYKTWTTNIVDSTTRGVQHLKNLITVAGYSKPIYMTEGGFDTSQTQTMLDFLGEPATVRYTLTARWFLTFAAYGVKSVSPWHYSSNCCFGALQTDTYGVQKAYNDIGAAISGKTITKIRHHSSGKVEVYLSTGEIVSV